MKKALLVLTLCTAFFLSSANLAVGQIPSIYPLSIFLEKAVFEKWLELKELSAAPSHSSGYGKVYVLSSDGHLYSKDASGSATDITAGASVPIFYDEGAENGAFTIDWTNGKYQKVTITGVALNITFTEPTNPGVYILMIVQGDADDTLDWEHEISPKWPGGVEPTLSTGAADVDFISFFFDGTTTYYGLFNGNFE